MIGSDTGNARYGERYRTAARITGYDEQTLMNYVYVAAHVPAPRRRRTVSWSHHAEIAKLGAEDQEAWLERILEDRLSVRDLRVELRALAPKRRGTVAPASNESCLCPTCGRPWSPALESHPTTEVRG